MVISDAGPIFSLAMIDKLDLLENLFDEVFIPEAVWKEITKHKSSKSNFVKVQRDRIIISTQ